MDYPKYETILTEMIEPNIMLVTLNRPNAYNALSHQMCDDLTDLWVRLKVDLDTRVVILKGAGEKGFCAGLDMKEGLTEFELTAPGFLEYQIRLGELELKMQQIPQPIIAAIHGSATGAGFSFAMSSDIRVISKDARFAAFYINVGLGGADMCSSYKLPRLIGTGRAYEYLLTGNFMSAEEAMNLGFASRCVEREELLPTALELARAIASKDPLAVRLTKEAININVDAAGFENALAVENRNQTIMCLHNLSKSPNPIGSHLIEKR
jgi:enoyl-CoA hydratase/carnithine racemase